MELKGEGGKRKDSRKKELMDKRNEGRGKKRNEKTRNRAQSWIRTQDSSLDDLCLNHWTLIAA